MEAFLIILQIVAIFGIWFGGIYFYLWMRYGRKPKPDTSPRRFKKEPMEEDPARDPCDPDPGYPEVETIDFNCASFLEEVRSGPFLFKPVIQPGLDYNSSPGTSLEIVWASLASDGDWKVDIKCGEPCSTAQIDSLEKQLVNLKRLTDHALIRARVSGLKPGQRFEYQVFHNGALVFKATAQAPFDHHTRAHRFVAVGDMGTGGSGQRRIASLIWDVRPDLVAFTGDITYRYGRAGEYLLRFFPIYNADLVDAYKGAPILRSTLSFTSAGNHCMGKAHPEDIPSFSTYSDLYAYYLYWSLPLNGPSRKTGDSSTPHTIGAESQVNAFLDLAGNRFPQMANYSFDYGNVHWLVLDANSYMDWTDVELRAWVEKDLAQVDPSMWKLVNFHHPPFTSNLKHKREKRMRLLCDIFEKYGVNVVFNGHSHMYERTYPLKFSIVPHEDGSLIDKDGQVKGDFVFDRNFDGREVTRPDGIIYIVTGAGGAPHDSEYVQRRPHLWEPFTYRLVGDRFSITVCDVDGDRLVLRQIDEFGGEIDKIVIDR